MRLWSLHPSLLDSKGLVALWREALLAQKVLRGETKGYRHHPQLARFRASSDPLTAIATYLKAVHEESRRRGYRFDASKILGKPTRARLRVTRGQLDYEWEHLRSKLKRRDPQAVARRKAVRRVIAHPLFRVVPGDVEEWERRRQ